MIPILNKTYYYFDDGKIRPSRRSMVVIKEIIPFNEIDKETLTKWEGEVNECDWLYRETTDYFIKAEANQEDITYRNGANATDLLVVTGDIGSAYMGLQVLEREKQVFQVNPNSQPDLEAYTYLIERQLRPEARKDVRTLLHALEIKPTAMIDISDGLSSEIMHICKQSKVGCNLYEDKLLLDRSAFPRSATCA